MYSLQIIAFCKDPLLPRNEKQKSFSTSFRLRPSKCTARFAEARLTFNTGNLLVQVLTK